ncbi:MAG TPA: YbdD/YjiX family protein [Steroidobacteraceae bacterium]|nr:YbdD/YjiX family protein [Steroidobacteraceae bacterium]
MASPRSNAVRQFLSSGLSLLRGVTGDDAYEKYLAHMLTNEPEATPLSERDFFRAQMEQRWNCINGCC